MTDEALAAFHIDDILAGAPYRTGPHADSLADSFRTCREEGAAVVLGLIAMAEAIRRRKRKCPTCRCYISIAADGCGCCASAEIDRLIYAATDSPSEEKA